MAKPKTWRERIMDARRRGKFTKYEQNLAASWSRCAVGEQREAMPFVVVVKPECPLSNLQSENRHARLTAGAPADSELNRLGFEFYDIGVCVHNFDEAERILELIEDRVLQLKREKRHG